jgi:hypothetical protein
LKLNSTEFFKLNNKENPMGLAERRAVEEFKTTLFPGLNAKIDQAAGFSVPLDVAWETLAADGYGHIYNDSFTRIYFEPPTAAFSSICRDQMGKDALKSALKSVVFCNRGSNFSGSGFTFEGGILTLDHEPCTNVDNVNERTDYIVKLIESSL